MEGIRVRMRSHGEITILHILGVKALHDSIRDFARDTTAPTPACNFRRGVVADILRRCPWQRKWSFQADPEDVEDHRHGEWYLRMHLEHGFKIWYHGHGLVRVHHRTIVDSESYYPNVKYLVLRWETRDVEHGRNLLANRFEAWERRVQGRTWTAACSNDWYHRMEWSDSPEDEDLRWLQSDMSLYKNKGDKIEHIIDTSTLTLLQE